MERLLLYMAGFVACIAIGYAALEAGLFLQQGRHDEVQLAQQTSTTLTNINRTVLIVGGTTTNIEKMTRDWKDQSVAQVKAATEATTLLNDDLTQLGVLIQTANTSLVNQNVQLTALEKQGSDALVGADAKTDALFTQLQPAIDSISTNVPVTMKNVTSITTTSADTSEQFALTSHDFHAFVHRETAPVRGTWNILKSIFTSFAGPSAQVATAIGNR